MDHHYSRLMRMIRHAQDGGTAGGGESTGTTDGATGGNQDSATQTGDSGSDDSGSTEKRSDPTFTRADLDREITKAIKAREQRLKAEFERKQAEEKQDWEKIARDAEARAAALELAQGTTRMLAEQNLSHLAPVFDMDLSSLEGREQFAVSIAKQIESTVRQRVNEQLATKPPAKSTKESDGKVQPMSAEEWAKHRKQHGLQ